MKWLEVVKKHIKLNPGKSIRDLMPEIKKEYYGLTKSKKVHHKKTHHKKTHRRKSRKTKSRKTKRR